MAAALLALRMKPDVWGAEGPLLIAAASVIVVALVIAAIVHRRRRRRADLERVIAHYGFEPLPDDRDAPIHAAVIDLFGEGPRIEQLLRKRLGGLDAYLVIVRIPLYRVDEGGFWDDTVQESQVKLLLMVGGMDAALPNFRLMPNSWALTTVRGEQANLFHNIHPMGWRNYVMGADADWIHHVLAGEPTQLLRRNHQLTINSRGGFLTFFLQGERTQPRDLQGFIAHCFAIARAITARAATYQPDQSPAAL